MVPLVTIAQAVRLPLKRKTNGTATLLDTSHACVHGLSGGHCRADREQCRSRIRENRWRNRCATQGGFASPLPGATTGESDDSKGSKLSLAELATRYLAYVAHQRALSTKRIHFAHFRRVLGNPPIHTLTVEVLDRYRGQRREQDGVGPATINREMGTLKNAMTKAVEWKLLWKSVREDLAAVKKIQEPDGRLRYLSGPPEARGSSTLAIPGSDPSS